MCNFPECTMRPLQQATSMDTMALIEVDIAIVVAIGLYRRFSK